MTLNTLSSRAASLLAAACLTLATAYGQTVYSSPVKVTNTPLPVSGSMSVTGVVPVTVPNGQPLPVKIGDTVPVQQQGTVTVAPSGGTMPVSGTVSLQGTPSVTISGTPAVALSGTPTVTLGAGDNLVKLAGTPFALDGTAELPDGVMFNGYAVATFPAGSYSEIEFASMRCGFEQPGRLWVAELGVTTPGFGSVKYPMPMVSYLLRGTHEWYLGATPVKIYAQANSQLYVHMQRSTGDTGYAKCTVSVSGRSY